MNIKDLKVLELASVLAGPQVGTFFSELGATVIKIENKTTGGDVTRNWKLDSENKDDSISAYYASANYGKKSIFLDFKDKADLSRLKTLISGSDIIITNFKPGDAKKFNLTYSDCKILNPKIVYSEITGFGKNVNRTAFDVILQAETGYISMTGSNVNDIAKLPVAFIDLFAAHQLKEGILLALLQNMRPVCVSVSLYDSAIASLANQASNYLMESFIPKPIGTQHPNIAPYGDIFLTKDQKRIIVAAGTEKQFKSLMSIIGIKDVPEMYSTNKLRVKNRNELNEILEKLIKTQNSEELLNACLAQNVPAGRVNNLKDVFEKPESQNLILSERIEEKDTKRVKTVVFTFFS